LYFKDTLAITHRAEEKPVTQTVFLGYTLDHANEAMARPLLARTVQSDGTIDEARYAREREHEQTHAHPSVGRQVLNATGYPFALAIGVKNDGRKQKHERYEEERRGAIPWQRLGH
jgi:hypothetical protein